MARIGGDYSGIVVNVVDVVYVSGIVDVVDVVAVDWGGFGKSVFVP